MTPSDRVGPQPSHSGRGQIAIERSLDVAELGHVEILSPKPEESVRYFEQMLGMEVAATQGQSTYLRAYEDWYHSSLTITESPVSGMGHVAMRTRSEAALQRRVAAIEAAGLGIGWVEESVGHGPGYRFNSPDGHVFELYWEVEYYAAPDGQRTALLNRPQRRPSRGVPVRRLDHVNLLAADPRPTHDFFVDALGFLPVEVYLDNTDEILAEFFTVNQLPHNIGMFRDPTGARGRLHHICYWYGVPQYLFDLVELLNDAGYEVERAPGKHGVAQGMFLYVFEPGGNRVELWGDIGFMVTDPSWETIVWRAGDKVVGVWIGAPTPDGFIARGTPPVEGDGTPAQQD
jgi:catechol 2,3-dioxygenase